MLALLMILVASEHTDLDVVGFSPDGAYVAIVESGVQDGTGWEWATASIIDVKKNDFVGKAISIENEADAKQRARQGLDTAGKALGVTAWKPATKESLDAQKKLLGASQDIRFNVDARPVPQKARPAGCSDEIEPMMATVSLRIGTAAPIPLQTDKRLPKARGCAFAYAIEAVFTAGTSILVIVRYKRAAFEGPDERILAVTAKLSAPLITR